MFFKVFFDNLESVKRIIRLEKSLEKVLNSASKNLYEPWAFKQCFVQCQTSLAKLW